MKKGTRCEMGTLRSPEKKEVLYYLLERALRDMKTRLQGGGMRSDRAGEIPGFPSEFLVIPLRPPAVRGLWIQEKRTIQLSRCPRCVFTDRPSPLTPSALAQGSLHGTTTPQRIEPWGSWWETPNGLGRRKGLSKYKWDFEVFKLFVLAYLSLWTHLRTKFQHQDYSDLKIRWIALPVFHNGFTPLSTILSKVSLLKSVFPPVTWIPKPETRASLCFFGFLCSSTHPSLPSPSPSSLWLQSPSDLGT